MKESGLTTKQVPIRLGDLLQRIPLLSSVQRCSLGIVVPVLNWFPRSQAASFPRPATFSPSYPARSAYSATVMTAA